MNIREEILLEVAKEIYPTCIESVQKVLWSGQSCGEKNPAIAASKMAVRYADELLYQVNIYSKLFTKEEREQY